MFDLTTYVKKWRIRQLKTIFSTLDTLWDGGEDVNRSDTGVRLRGLQSDTEPDVQTTNNNNSVSRLSGRGAGEFIDLSNYFKGGEFDV